MSFVLKKILGKYNWTNFFLFWFWQKINKNRLYLGTFWLKVEIYACEANAELGLIPKQALKEIKTKAQYNIKPILNALTPIEFKRLAASRENGVHR